MDNQEYVCVRCSRAGKTCCSMEYGLAEECFPLSHKELQRIKKALLRLKPELMAGNAPNVIGALQNGSPIFGVCKNTHMFMEAMDNLFPHDYELLRKFFPESGSHLHLKLTKKHHDCVFLADTGCILPQTARPWFCKIFPFWVIKKQILFFAPEDCLAVAESNSVHKLLKNFSMTKQNILDLYTNLRADWGLS